MAKKKIPDLIIEPVSELLNSSFLSLIEHHGIKYLTVINNITEDMVTAYVLDIAEQERIDLKLFISIVSKWYEAGATQPLSFELAGLGLSSITKRIFKQFEADHVTRLIGTAFKFNLTEEPKLKRRRATFIYSPQEINLRALA